MRLQIPSKPSGVLVIATSRKHTDVPELTHLYYLYETFLKVQQSGHAIGNHTFHHLNGWHTPPGLYLNDVLSCRDYFETKLFRPPYGRFTPSQYFLLRKDFRFILWSVLTYDYHHRTSPAQCLQNAVRNSGSGSVVVFHDSLKALNNLKYALPLFLEHFLERGYRFNPIDETSGVAIEKL